MAYSAKEVAKWLLLQAERDSIDVSPMKLQKLLYYAQGNFLGMTGEKLFDEDIQKWQHGSVVPSIYNQYKKLGNQAIPPVGEVSVPEELENFISYIIKAYGEYSAVELRNKTHEEAPYKSTDELSEITTDVIEEFFTDEFWTSDEEDNYEPSFDTEKEEKEYFKKSLSSKEKRMIINVCASGR